MNYLIILIVLVVFSIILAIIYDVNIKKFETYAKNEEKRLNSKIDKYPSNKEICMQMLRKINNNNVKIEENKDSKTCLYIAVTNKIIIADVKNSYTRIQTIAHECLHSKQNRKILLFNFIFSNIYFMYFALIAVLAIFKIIKNGMLYINIMLFLSYVYYFVRSYLENDAMIKARYLSEEYMKETKILQESDVEEITKSYDEINKRGIKIVNYNLMFGTILKVILLDFIFFIR